MSATFDPILINALLRSRRTITPDFFTNQPISKEILENILENATWAPTHKMTQPWFFRVYTGKGLERLGNYLADYYKQHTPENAFSPVKYEKTREKATRSAAVILIGMKRSAKELIPEWEEIAAVACAVQNLWLSATAYGLGGYWSTPEAIMNPNDFVELAADERCLGIFYLGFSAAPDSKRKRIPLREKLSWILE